MVAFFSKKEKQGKGEEKISKELLEEEKRYRAGTLSIIDLIAPAAMEVKPNYLRLGTTFVRTLFVISYPRYITIGWFSPIINFSNPLDISMFF